MSPGITPSEFFEERREWSQRKHEVLSEYVKLFGPILSKNFGPTIFVVDGFAGSGSYGEGADRTDGSPLLIAKIAAAANGYVLRCINVELSGPEFESLEEATKPFGDAVANIHGAFADYLEEILTYGIKDSPAFFFLDPFGVKGLEWDTLERLSKRPLGHKTELLINFSTPAFMREAGFLFKDNEQSKPFLETLDRVMGPLDWRVVCQDRSVPSDTRQRRIVELYCDGIEKDLGFKASKFAIREQGDGTLKYYLVHGTRNDLGRRLMGDVFYGAQKRYLEARARGKEEREAHLAERFGRQLGFGGEFGIHLHGPTREELEQADVAQLKSEIADLLRTERHIRFVEIQNRLIPRWFGRMVEKHYRSACRSLREQGHVTWEGKSKRAIPGLNDDTVVTWIAE